MKTILTLLIALLFSVSANAQSVQITEIFNGTTFTTTATNYLSTTMFGSGQIDSMVVVAEVYDSLSAAIKLISYSPNGIPIDTVTAIAAFTTATATIAKVSATITPLIKRQFLRAFVTANSTNGQSSNNTRLRVFIYKYGLRP